MILPGVTTAMVWELIALTVVSMILAPKASGQGSQLSPGINEEFSGTVEPRRIVYGQTLVSGMNCIPPWCHGSKNEMLDQVLAVAGHRVDSITDVYADQTLIATANITAIAGNANDGKVTSGTYANKLWIRRYVGLAAGNLDYILNTAWSSYWDANHLGKGVAYVAVQYHYDTTVYSGGKPEMRFLVKGKRCYDPRLDGTPGADPTNAAYIAYTNNPALCIIDYLMDTTLGLGEAATRIDWTAAVVAAHCCDETVSIPSSTQKRYTIGAVLDCTQPYEDNLKTLASAMQGAVLYSAGKWILLAGKNYSSAFDIVDDDIIGSMTYRTAIPYADRYNAVRGQFYDPLSMYQPVEYPQIRVAGDESADGEGPVWRELQQPTCTDQYEAQRNAIILQRRSRDNKSWSFRATYRLYGIRPGEFGTLSSTELGLASQTVRCIGWKLNMQTMHVEIALEEVTSTDWNDPATGVYQTTTALSKPAPNNFISDPVTGFSGAGYPGGITFAWGLPAIWYNSLTVELLEAATNDIAGATVIWSGVNTGIFIQKNDTTVRYYWARVRNVIGNTVSATTPAGATAGWAQASQRAAAPSVSWTPNLSANMQQVSPGSFKKVSGNTAWDEQVYSKEAYPACAVSWVVHAVAGNDYFIALNTDPATDANYTGLDFSIEIDGTNTRWTIYESAANPLSGAAGSAVVGDCFAITYDGLWVRYYRNGALLRSVSAPQKILYLDSSFYLINSQVDSLNFVPISLAVANVSWTPVMSGGVTQIASGSFNKTSGAQQWDGQVYSKEGYASCAVSWKVPAVTNNDYFIALDTNPGADANYTGLDYSIEMYGAGTYWLIYENGSVPINGAAGSMAVGDTFTITYDGKTVRYYRNGVILRSVSVVRNPILYLDSSFAIVGSQVDSLAFVPLAQVDQIGRNLLDPSQWKVGGTATQGYFTELTGSGNNAIVLAGTSTHPLGPQGVSEPIWRTVGSAGSGSDGGWDNTAELTELDSSKTYRSSVWLWWNGVGTTGDFYHGLSGSETNDLAGAAAGNPYYSSPNLYGNISSGKWYLAVGFLHGSGFGTVSSNSGGIFDPATGARVLGATEYKWIAGKKTQTHRVYNYYSANTGAVVYFARPRFEEVTGNEPSILALLGIAGTGMLAPNSATLIASAYKASYSASGTAQLHALSLTMPVNIFDSVLQATVDFYVKYGTFNIGQDIYLNAEYAGDSWGSNALIAPTAVKTHYTLTWNWSVPGDPTTAAIVYLDWAPLASGNTATFTDITMRAEFVKR